MTEKTTRLLIALLLIIFFAALYLYHLRSYQPDPATTDNKATPETTASSDHYDPLDLDRISHKSNAEINAWHDDELRSKMSLYDDMPLIKAEIDSIDQVAHQRFPFLRPH
jgi:hypothetical protein